MRESLADLLAKGRALADVASQAPTACVGGCGKVLAPPARICEQCEARRRRNRRLDSIASLVPASYQWASFGVPELSQRVASPAAVLKARALRDAHRVVFVGAAGTGKTCLAVAMMRARVEAADISAVFAPAWKLGVARARAEDSEAGMLSSAFRAELLVLDDLGSERNVPSNPVPDVLFERHAEAKATWITTWMTPEALACQVRGRHRAEGVREGGDRGLRRKAMSTRMAVAVLIRLPVRTTNPLNGQMGNSRLAAVIPLARALPAPRHRPKAGARPA